MLDGGPLLCWPRNSELLDRIDMAGCNRTRLLCTCYWVLGNLKAVPPRAQLST